MGVGIHTKIILYLVSKAGIQNLIIVAGKTTGEVRESAVDILKLDLDCVYLDEYENQTASR